MELAIFWFRRDLRIEDNTALNAALSSGFHVLPIFIFDTQILTELPKNDARVQFIHECLQQLNKKLATYNSSLLVLHATPLEAFKQLAQEYNIKKVFINKDYEPYARQRDAEIVEFLSQKNIALCAFKDQVVFEENEVTKDDGNPYTVYTPYKNKWLQQFQKTDVSVRNLPNTTNFLIIKNKLPSLQEMGFTGSAIKVKPYTLSSLSNYDEARNFPYQDETSYLSPHLRFGTVSVRQVIEQLKANDATFLSELIWREFFMQILWHFPKVVDQNFKAKYNGVAWRNDEAEFEKWQKGETGFPIVDAGMRQLNETGYMHNRVRMITAGFLCKHLLIDWKWGEAYFAKRLLDYELSANNGNWQWSAGTGCDAAPYFRIFNPTEQVKKFDPKLNYIKKWVTNWDTLSYPQPMVEHSFARERALETYKKGLLE